MYQYNKKSACGIIKENAKINDTRNVCNMYLPVIIAIKNDETTASWIRRLTLANGFDNTEEFAQQFICDSDIANEQRFKAMLGTEDFISLY